MKHVQPVRVLETFGELNSSEHIEGSRRRSRLAARRWASAYVAMTHAVSALDQLVADRVDQVALAANQQALQNAVEELLPRVDALELAAAAEEQCLL
jgi:hypothetical protein